LETFLTLYTLSFSSSPLDVGLPPLGVEPNDTGILLFPLPVDDTFCYAKHLMCFSQGGRAGREGGGLGVVGTLPCSFLKF